MSTIAEQPRLSQKEVTRRLVLFQYLEIQSARLLGGWLPGIRRWEHKHAAAHHLWQDAQRSKALRTRLWELKISRPERQLPENAATVPDALAHAQDDDEFLTGLYLGLKSDLLAAYRALIETTHPVNDAPTVQTLERLIPELEAQIEWARGALEESPPSEEDRRRLDRFLAFVRSHTAAFLSGPEDPKEEPLPPPPGYGNSPLPFSEAKRDERFELHFTGIPRPEPDDAEGNRLFQFVNYAHEMQAAETLGSVLWEVGDMTWEFYYDVARHCYDEARHCQLGETRLAELGRHITEFPHCVTNYNWRQLIDPLRRYCVLTYVIEQDSFQYKHESYKRYLQEDDNESAEAVLFDIADETMHVRWGQKWVPELMKQAGYEGDAKELTEECRQILREHSVNPVQKAYAEK